MLFLFFDLLRACARQRDGRQFMSKTIMWPYQDGCVINI